MFREIRDLLLALYAVVWSAVVLVTLWRTGTVSNELLASLGVGVGGLLAAFRADNYVGRRRAGRAERPEQVEGPP